MWSSLRVFSLSSQNSETKYYTHTHTHIYTHTETCKDSWAFPGLQKKTKNKNQKRERNFPYGKIQPPEMNFKIHPKRWIN